MRRAGFAPVPALLSFTICPAPCVPRSCGVGAEKHAGMQRVLMRPVEVVVKIVEPRNCRSSTEGAVAGLKSRDVRIGQKTFRESARDLVPPDVVENLAAGAVEIDHPRHENVEGVAIDRAPEIVDQRLVVEVARLGKMSHVFGVIAVTCVSAPTVSSAKFPEPFAVCVKVSL